MAVTHVAATRNAIADAVVDRLDLGSTDATGDIAFTTAADAVLCINNLANPAFGAAASGVATANAIANGTVTVAGTIARAQFRDRNNAEVFRCAVGTSGSDINLSSVAVNINDTISISSLTYTAPA
jgi:hypothetical protein